MHSVHRHLLPLPPGRSTVHYFQQKRKLKRKNIRTFPANIRKEVASRERQVTEAETGTAGIRVATFSDGGVPRAEPTFDNRKRQRVRNEKKWGRSRAMVEGNIKKNKNEVHKHAMHTRTEEGPPTENGRAAHSVFFRFSKKERGQNGEAGHQPGRNGCEVGLTSASRRPKAGGAWRRRSRRKGLARKT